MSSGDDTLQARRMNRIYRVQKYFYDWTRPFFLPGRNALLREMNVPEGGSVLEVGCGTGRNLAVLARRRPDLSLTGLDVSSEMLSIARARPELVEWIEGTVDLLPAERNWDAIFFSYSLSMIPDWKSVVLWALSSLRPDGSLHVVDFGDFRGLPAPLRAPLGRWLDLFGVRHDAQWIQEIAAQIPHFEVRSLWGGYAIRAQASNQT